MILEEKERGVGMGVYHGRNEKLIVRTYRATMVITKSKRTPHKYHNVTRGDSIQRIDLKKSRFGLLLPRVDYIAYGYFFFDFSVFNSTLSRLFAI